MAGNLYKSIRKHQSSHYHGDFVLNYWIFTAWQKAQTQQSCTELVKSYREWLCQLKYTLFIMMRHWIQQFVMHIICKGCDLFKSWMNSKLPLLCSTDAVRTQFTFCCYPSFQYICAPLKSYTNKTKLMPKIHPNYKQSGFFMTVLELSEEAGDNFN